ncbi:MAG TPA: Mut7-C RNAse domain-containing protein [Thermodesulfobacteriota bacterium]|nr:Mut7-C RNAse domain-containing protein [Thermodesulfobacteriota bacterium]
MAEGFKKIFADSMLGKLALWMRVMGYDVEYEKAIDDGELVRRARKEGRVILTRDTLLIKRRWARDNHLFIKSDHLRDQLKEAVSFFGIKKERFLTRCLRCNVTLADIERESVKDSVPPYVYSTQESFSKCPVCGRIYWAGTHRENMEKEVERIVGGLK